MNKFFTVSLIVLDILLLNILSLQAQNIDSETEKCRNAIKEVKNSVQAKHQIMVKLSEIKKVTYSDHPKGRPNQYNFAINGNEAESMLNYSDALMNDSAKQIINSCNSIGLVRFGEYQTGNIVDNGLMPNGEVKSFKCPKDYDPPYSRDLVWGESCGI